MAARYWVTGGTGATNSTTNWSTTSGGSSGASVPGTTDDAIWDANSGTGTVNVNATLSVLSADFTNFGGNLGGSQSIQLYGGDITYGIGMTIGNTGNLIFAASGTINSNGKEISGAITVNTGFPNGGTITLNGDFKCGSFAHTVIAGTVNLNGSDLYLKGHTLTFVASPSRTISGTSTIRLVTTTTTLSISITGQINNNVIINATNTINQIGSINIGNNATWTYITGTWNPNNTAFGIGAGGATFDLAGMNIYQLSIVGAGGTLTLLSKLTISSNILMQQNYTFAGTFGFEVPLFILGTNAVNGRTLTLKAGIEYIITGELRTLSIGMSNRCIINSDTPGTKTILTLTQGANSFPAFVNITDVDSSRGRLCKTFNGTLSNTTNWLSVTSDVPTSNAISIN